MELARRTLVKGAAWSVPAVVAVQAAPALAASKPCIYQNATWTGGQPNGSGTALTGASLSWQLRGATKWEDGGFFPPFKNATIQQRNTAFDDNNQLVNNWIAFGIRGDNRQGAVLTVNFNQPVYCLSFGIADFDAMYAEWLNQYRDQMTITVAGGGPALSVTPSNPQYMKITPSGSSVTVEAAQNPPKDYSDPYEWNPFNEDNGTILLQGPGPYTQITFHYSNAWWDGGTTRNNEQVLISAMRYATSDCACA